MTQIQEKIKTLVSNIDLSLLNRCLIILSTFLVTLIPCDVLAVYFIESPVKSSSAPSSLTSFSFDKPSAEISSFKQTVGSSAIFGAMTATGLVNLIDSLSEIRQALALKGIIAIGGKDAILENKETKKSFFLKEGDAFKNWTVKQIKEDSLILSDGKNEAELKIEEHAA